MKKLNIPLIPAISGVLALAAVIAVIVVVLGAGSDAGLHVTSATGTVSIMSSDNTTVDTASGEALRSGDIITVGGNSSCTLVYKSNKNSENNYITVGENSQIVINDKFSGTEDGVIYLNRGSVLCNLAETDKARVLIRTADTMISPSSTVSKIAYTTDGFESDTEIHTFMGNSKIQLYDTLGNPVNDAEYLVEKLKGKVTASDLGPQFAYLNIEFDLSELSAGELKELVTICNLTENFPYSLEELKAAYDAAAAAQDTETTPPATSDTSEVIQTAAPITTTAPVITEETHEATTGPAITTRPRPVTTTAAPVTTAPPATTTKKPAASTAAATTVNKNQTFVVFVIVGDEETIQEVAYGQDAEQPEDPVIEGKKFVRWDGSFKNITADTTITAIFEDDASVTTSASETTAATDSVGTIYHTVSVVILDKITTIQVEDGQPAPLPTNVEIEGYDFKGWDKPYDRITSSVTITAILEEESYSVNVTFMISGLPYYSNIERGGTAIPPFIPDMDINGRKFTGWDRPLTNITEDTVITAVFGESEYTVTFVIDGISYPVKVKNGESAVPPFTPQTDSHGRMFIGWDQSFYIVTSDMTVNALYL
ncbi:MAG: InlB B-repeat-containing protein [Oscillospiraceae bacterium]|nr:InlB B-repeat-containing protein [Oscillospiraceae bacterium]